MMKVSLNSKFWSKYDKRVNESRPGTQVFWESSSSNSGNEDVKKKIISTFCEVNYSSRFNGLIQFWAPTGGRGHLLSTTNQPFSFEDLDSLPYWLCCSRNQSRIATHDNAFLNCYPEVVTDLEAYKGKIPLLDKALDCGFTCLILLPVFYPDSSSCLGVVECCMNPSGLVQLCYSLKVALRNVGLSTYDVKQSLLPYDQNMHRATHEIQEALNIVCQSHHLTLAQVWIPIPSPSDQKQKFVVRLCDYIVDVSDSDYHPDIQTYNDFSGMLPLKIGEGLPGKTLETSIPHFCKILEDLMLTDTLLGELSCSLDFSSLVISLKNTSLTGDVVYAFEFLWPHSRNHVIVLESLLLTLKRCLPSFSFPSGAQLGDELRLLDFGYPGTRYFNILQPQPLKQGNTYY